MQFTTEPSLKKFFDVSVIMHFNNDVNLLQTTILQNQYYFERNGVELIIIASDDINEMNLIILLKSFPYINCKLFVNRGHDNGYSRNECLNIAIRNSSNKFILAIDIGTILITDVIAQMRYLLKHYEQRYAIATLVSFDDKQDNEGCTLMMINKKDIEAVCGFNEEIKYSFESNLELRHRLEMNWVEGIWSDEIIAEQTFKPGHGCENKALLPCSLYIADKDHVLRANCNDEIWGQAFQVKLSFDWQRDKDAGHREKLLQSFRLFWHNPMCVFEKEYPIVCLMQIRNESKHIPEVLQHLDSYCDGIVLLDDDSTDGSFEMAISDKLLLKVKKDRGEKFDDLGNRNILLQLGHLFNAKWFLFMDADERFDKRYSDLKRIIANSAHDTILFRLVHIWNEKKSYRIDVPRSEDGILLRYRMFRNRGFTQIQSDKQLHFPVTPFILNPNKLERDILILHYGLMDKNVRMRKFKDYSKQDNGGKLQGHGYDYLLDDAVTLGNIDELRLLES